MESATGAGFWPVPEQPVIKLAIAAQQSARRIDLQAVIRSMTDSVRQPGPCVGLRRKADIGATPASEGIEAAMKMEPLERVRAPGVKAGSRRFGQLLRTLARVDHGGVLICGGQDVQCDALAMALARLRDQPLMRVELEAANDGPITSEQWRPSLQQAREHAALLYLHLGEGAEAAFGREANACTGLKAEHLLADVQRAGVVVIVAGAERYSVALEACWPRIRLPDLARLSRPASISPRPLPVAQVISR
jgi:hypothetical protein